MDKYTVSVKGPNVQARLPREVKAVGLHAAAIQVFPGQSFTIGSNGNVILRSTNETIGWVTLLEKEVIASTDEYGRYIQEGANGYKYYVGCKRCQEIKSGAFPVGGPEHRPSSMCRSGKSPHCSCDACF